MHGRQWACAGNDKAEALASHIPHAVEALPDMILFTYNGGTVFKLFEPNEVSADPAETKVPPTDAPAPANTLTP